MNKIWYEITHIKYGEIYLTKYLAYQKRLKKIFQIVALIVSMSGILSWKFFEEYVWIAFLLIAIIQLVLLVEDVILRADKEIEQIAELRMMYTKYFFKLELLWSNYEYKRDEEINCIDKYFDLRQRDWRRIEELDTKLNIKSYTWLMKKAEIDTMNYLNNYHLNE